MRDDGYKCLLWPTGVIQRVFPGKDGNIRATEIKTRSGLVTRPIQRLHIQEIGPDSVPDSLGDASEPECDLNLEIIDPQSHASTHKTDNDNVQPKVTHYGCKVKPIVKLVL